MNRRAFIACFLALLAAPLAAEAQPAKVPRIGILRAGTAPDPGVEGFRQGLRELGYVEGQNVVIEYRWAEGKPDRLSDLAAELVRLRVDVIVTGGQQATRVAASATNAIPIVTGTGGIPATDLVASLARPGGNVTGLTLINVELSAKRVELLKEALPGISRVAVLKSPRNPSHGPIWKETQRAAALLHLQLQPVDVRESGDLEGAFAAMKRARAEAYILAPDEFFFAWQSWPARPTIGETAGTARPLRSEAERRGTPARAVLALRNGSPSLIATSPRAELRQLSEDYKRAT